MSPAAPVRVRLERLRDGDFVPVAEPRVSWQVPDGDVLGSEIRLDVLGSTMTAHIDGGDRVLVAWPFAPLESRTIGSLSVRSQHPSGWSEWSDPLAFETTLLKRTDWSAEFIRPRDGGRIGDPAPSFATTFPVPNRIARARLYISAHGVFEAEIDGYRVGEDLLAPGWTSYRKRLRFLTYDVTALLESPSVEHRLTVAVGNGWFRGRLGWSGSRAFYGDDLGVIAQLEMTDDEGRVHTVRTDETWVVGEGPIVADDIYDGMQVDFTRAMREGGSVVSSPRVTDVLFPSATRPIRELARWRPVAIHAVGAGRTIVDAGQNLTGWLSLRVRGGRGRRVEISHAEVLVDGRLETETLRSAEARDVYVLDGAERVLEPRFTFHGFRYAEVRGIALEEILDIEVVAIGSDLERTGWFVCSDERLNRLHANIVRSARSNLIDVPIDCPQRDERLGWTGDLQMFAPAGAFLFDLSGMLDGWLADLRADQHPDGAVPVVIPDVLRGSIAPGAALTAGFSDAAVLVPLAAYRAYGDEQMIRDQWPSALAWVRRVVSAAGDDGIRAQGFQFGDWLDPSAPSSDPSRAMTPADLVATAALIRVLDGALALARVVAPGDSEELRDASERIRRAFRERFVTADGLVVGDSVSGYVFALRSGGLDSRQRSGAAQRLRALIRDRGFTASTGFLGTAQVLDALDEVDAPEIALRLLRCERMPSWLAQVALGATTVWERWDSMDAEGVVNDPFMTSFNHYALGSVADWMHRRLGGLEPIDPGYARVRVAPLVTSAIDFAEVRLDTLHGPVRVRWARTGHALAVEIDLPPDVDAVVEIPGVPSRLGPGAHRFHVDLVVPAKPAVEEVPVARALEDEQLGRRLVATLVRLGIADDPEDAHHRLAPYADLPLGTLSEHFAHPAFRASGPFVQRAFQDALPLLLEPHVRTY